MRDLALDPTAAPVTTPTEPPGPPVIVVGSGKGGVGKSVVATLMAVEVARQGRRALLVDGAQNLGNLHVLLGISPAVGLECVAAGDVDPHRLIHRLGDNLWLVPSASGTERLYALGPVDRARLQHHLATVYDDFDAVIVDAPSELEAVVRLATMRGTRLVVVTQTEPTALSDAYALVKIVQLQLPAFPIDVLVNRVRSDEDGHHVYQRFNAMAARFLGRSLGFLGVLGEEPNLGEAARRPGGLLGYPTPAPIRLAIAQLGVGRVDGLAGAGARS